MEPKGSILNITIFAVILGIVILAGAYFLPWGNVDWGKISFLPAATLTVTGEAREDVKSQVATFFVSVSAVNANKQKATDEVNAKMQKIVNDLKAFGIAEEDLQTQDISVYQNPEVEILIYPPKPNPGAGDWTASNSIEVKLRDINRTQSLVDLLNKSGATSVNGPNFALEQDQDESALLVAAIEDAKSKAGKIALASGRRLGKIITVSEVGGGPIYPLALESRDQGGVPTPVEPGTQTTYKSVTVIFELK